VAMGTGRVLEEHGAWTSLLFDIEDGGPGSRR